ncbi:MAG: hypothetical protein OEU86_00855 [Gammaproteobacteria bacterium]|nr:hypothetical protein [Gammaproteobacteria bacterium]
MPKLLDNLDSAAYAAHQAWAGYLRWAFLGFALLMIAIAVVAFSPGVRLFAIAAGLSYMAAECLDLVFARFVLPRYANQARQVSQAR